MKDENKKDVRVKSIGVKNFKAIDEILMEFDGGHTKIIAPNGHGKTSILDAFRACFMGVSQKGSKGELLGERFRFIGSKGKAADMEVRLEDMQGNFFCTVQNHMTAAGNGIKVIASDGRELSKEWARDLFNVIFRSADNFLKLSPKEQAIALGIDTSEFDGKIAQHKEVAKLTRRDLKALGEPVNVAKIERVDTNALSLEKDRITAHNQEQDDLSSTLQEHNTAIYDYEKEISVLREQIARKKELKDNMMISKGKLPDPKEYLSFDEVQAKITNADETNREATAYEGNEIKSASIAKVKGELDKTLADIDKVNEKRIDYIKGFDFSVKGLSVSEDGGLLLDDRFLASYSTAEREIIVNNLNKSLDPQFKTAFMDDYQNLDPAHQKKISEGLLADDIQLITFEVGEKKKGKGSILLNNCAVVGDNDVAKEEDEKPSLL